MGRSDARGRAGEAMAAAYLELMGFAVEARNTRIAGVEVDLVASDDRTIALVEVKLRTRTDYGGAALAVDRSKRERMWRAALAVGEHEGRAVRIDVIAIESHEHGATIRHYPNAVTEGTRPTSRVAPQGAISGARRPWSKSPDSAGCAFPRSAGLRPGDSL